MTAAIQSLVESHPAVEATVYFVAANIGAAFLPAFMLVQMMR